MQFQKQSLKISIEEKRELLGLLRVIKVHCGDSLKAVIVEENGFSDVIGF